MRNQESGGTAILETVVTADLSGKKGRVRRTGSAGDAFAELFSPGRPPMPWP